ncbi:MAG TPA: MFS transporter [Candidatus Limnocylindrales bacterium]|nr:MFS transporter [Candidatus Limnocylindrales bacterium]
MGRYVVLLRQRDFALLWGGATISALGDGMSFVAILWLLVERGGTAADVGWLAAIHTAPVIIGGIATGPILDAFDPRRVLAADNAIRGLAMASVPIAAAAGALTTAHLFVVAAVYGLLFMTSAAGIPSLITRLVRSEDLTTANAMESLSFSLSGLVGPGVAGLLIAIVGAPFVLAIDALTYFIFVICLLAMRRGGRDATAADTTQAGGSRGLGPAVRFIFSSSAIVAITLFYMSVNIAGGIVTVVIPLYVRDVLDAGSETFGLLLSVLTAGDLAGLLVVGAVDWRWPLGRSIAWALFTSGLVLLLWLLQPPAVILGAILFVWGALSSSLTPWAQTIRMRLIPPEMRGRVFALLRTAMQSTRPLGAVAAGLLLTQGSLSVAIIAMALLFAVPGFVGLWLPALGRGPTAEPEWPADRREPAVSSH